MTGPVGEPLDLDDVRARLEHYRWVGDIRSCYRLADELVDEVERLRRSTQPEEE